ncbi:MAG TPA: hypothetical protein VMD78_11690 [Candidatus Baltobacteraceae bacterium]|nr:hypothetical protein [Candidatus Baltobacteraceae bacterium]
MKVRIAAIVLTGILCATAPAWSDTISGHSKDAALVSHDSAQFDSHDATIKGLFSFFSDSGASAFDGRTPSHRMWDGWGPTRDVSSPKGSTTGDVAAPEPATLQMLALGLIALLGSALLLSPSRSRPV